MEDKSARKNRNILHIMVINLLDMLSYAMVMPVIALLFLDGPQSILDPNSENRHILFGIFLSTYSFIQIFSAPVWSKVAHVISRKRVLMLSLFGNAISYLICAASVYYKEVSLLFLGSILAGLTGANTSTIKAMISHESSQSEWTKNYSLLGSLVGLAFIIGPQMTNGLMLFVPSSIVCSYIFLICFAFALINCIYVLIIVDAKHSYQPIESGVSGLSLKSFTRFTLNDKILFSIIFCIYFGWYFFIKFYQVYLIDILDFSETQCLHASSYLGFCCCFWQGIRYYIKFKFVTDEFCLIWCPLIMALSILSFVSVSSFYMVLFLSSTLSLGFSFLVPSIMSILLGGANTDKDYKIALHQSVQSCAKISSPLISGLILSFSKMGTPIFSSAVVFISFFLVIYYKKELFILSSKPQRYRDA